MFTSQDHFFAICAYKESPYLAECIVSLKRQTVPAKMIIATATPNAYIERIAKEHQIPLFVNRGEHGIAEDWNFAYAKADAPLVTLAHQDDVYEPEYLEKMLAKINQEKKPLICFSDYYEVRDGEKSFANTNKNLRIKETALLPLRIDIMQRSKWMRRRILSLCDPICCPAVTYVKEDLTPKIFESHFKSNLDWEAWEKLSKLKGSFCYVHQPLMGHRIHEESTTTEVIGGSKGRFSEDLEMYLKFWPKPIALLLNHFYSGAQKSNHV